MQTARAPIVRTTLLLTAAALLVSGCASRTTATSSKLPKLLIATNDAGAAPMAAAAIAPGTGNAPDRPLGLFAGYVLAGTLPTQPTHAPVYVWPSTKPTQADVEKLATAFGLTGTPERHSQGWDLKTATGELRVRDYPEHEWSYGRADMLACPSFQVDIDTPGNSPNGGYGCAVAPAPGTAANGPDEATTKAAAASLLTALGITGNEQFSPGAPASYLTVSPMVAGLPTQGMETNINVDVKGITSATGQLQAPTAGDDYPLQTAKAAFDSLASRPQPAIARYCGPMPSGPNRFGGVAPSAGSDTATTAIGIAPPAVPPHAVAPSAATAPSAVAAPSTVVAPPTPVGAPVPVNSVGVGSLPPDAAAPIELSPMPCPTPEPVKIAGATLGLEIEYNATSDGATILVPSWFFTLADGTLVTTAIAVDPSYLGTPPQPTDVSVGGGSSPGSTGGGGASAFTAVPPAASSAPALSPAAS